MAMAMRKQGQVESCRAWPHELSVASVELFAVSGCRRYTFTYNVCTTTRYYSRTVLLLTVRLPLRALGESWLFSLYSPSASFLRVYLFRSCAWGGGSKWQGYTV